MTGLLLIHDISKKQIRYLKKIAKKKRKKNVCNAENLKHYYKMFFLFKDAVLKEYVSSLILKYFFCNGLKYISTETILFN